MGHLTKKGGVLEGQTFPVLFDTEAKYGEEQGTIRNLTIRYLTEQKGFEKEGAIVKQLINEGKIDVPASEDGRYTNIASINVKALVFTNPQAKNEAITSRLAKIEEANPAEKQHLKRELILIEALNP